MVYAYRAAAAGSINVLSLQTHPGGQYGAHDEVEYGSVRGHTHSWFGVKDNWNRYLDVPTVENTDLVWRFGHLRLI